MSSVGSVKICINIPIAMYEAFKKRCSDVRLEIDVCIAKAIVEAVEREMERGAK